MSVSMKPQKIDDCNWYYEHRGYIELLHQYYDINGKYVETETIKIPRRKLETSLKRMVKR